jgi:hypothetical protein
MKSVLSGNLSENQFRRLDMEDGNFVPQYGAPRFVFILSGDVKLGWDS